MNRIQKHKRKPYQLFISATLFIALAAYVNITGPETVWHILLFIAVFALATAILMQYIFRRKRRALIIAAGTTIFLLLRYLGLTSPVYTTLLIAVIIATDVSLRRR